VDNLSVIKEVLESSRDDDAHVRATLSTFESSASEKHFDSEVSLGLNDSVINLSEADELRGQLGAELNGHELKGTTEEVEEATCLVLVGSIERVRSSRFDLGSEHELLSLNIDEYSDTFSDHGELSDALVLQDNADRLDRLLLHDILLRGDALIKHSIEHVFDDRFRSPLLLCFGVEDKLHANQRVLHRKRGAFSGLSQSNNNLARLENLPLLVHDHAEVEHRNDGAVAIEEGFQAGTVLGLASSDQIRLLLD